MRWPKPELGCCATKNSEKLFDRTYIFNEIQTQTKKCTGYREIPSGLSVLYNKFHHASVLKDPFSRGYKHVGVYGVIQTITVLSLGLLL
jgi:hypothetical protein